MKCKLMSESLSQSYTSQVLKKLTLSSASKILNRGFKAWVMSFPFQLFGLEMHCKLNCKFKVKI